MWGMALLSTCVIYLAPLIYIQNKEVIDGHLEHAGKVASQQAAQVRDLTAHHAGKSFETVKGYTGEYANKAGDFVGTARQKIPMPATKSSSSGLQQSAPSGVQEGDFPRAPASDLPPTSAEGLSGDKIKAEPVGETSPMPAY